MIALRAHRTRQRMDHLVAGSLWVDSGHVLLAQGMTLGDVKNQLGHSTIVLTSNTYGHVLEQRQRQVARAMDAALGA
jgi:integrase